MDVLEIDAASNRGIDEIRSLRESVKFLPVEGRKKIFIIDEAHMLTNEAWNALLKTIEEPPPHIMFIFATTEVDKLPVTILSRCQRYTFRRITAEDIAEHLLHVATESNIQLAPDAAQLIAIHADGGLRDALSILDQCSGMTTDMITAKTVETMIGLVGKEWIMEFLDYLRRGDGAAVLVASKQALSEGRDSKQIIEALIQHVRALLIEKVMPTAEELALYAPFKDAFAAQAEFLSVDELNYFVKELQQILNDAKRVDNPRIVIEMGLLGICARAQVSEEDVLQRLAAVEHRLDETDNQVSARLAQLESEPRVMAGSGGMNQGMPAYQGAAPQGSMPPGADMSGSTMPGGMVPNAGVPGTVPPGMTPHVGMAPPAIVAAPAPTRSKAPAKRKAPAKSHNGGSSRVSNKEPRIRSVMGDTSLILGQHIENPRNYDKIKKDTLRYAASRSWNYTSNFFNQAFLIYIDEVRAVFVFSNPLLVDMCSTEDRFYELEQSLYQALGRYVMVQILCQSDSAAMDYRNAAKAILTGQSAGSSNAPAANTRPAQQAQQRSNSATQHNVPQGPSQPSSSQPMAPQSTAPQAVDDFGAGTVDDFGASNAVSPSAPPVDDFGGSGSAVAGNVASMPAVDDFGAADFDVPPPPEEEFGDGEIEPSTQKKRQFPVI